MSESAASVTSTSAEVMLVVQGASLALRPLLLSDSTLAVSSAPLSLSLSSSGSAESAVDFAASSLIVAITPQSVIVINNSNNEVIRSFEMSKSAESEVKDALFVASKRCFVVLTSEGNITIIPWECKDARKLPKAALSSSNFSRIILDESDRVFGFTTDHRLCEINIAVGGASINEKSSKSVSKSQAGAKRGVVAACAVSGVGVATSSGEASSGGSLCVDVWSSSQVSAASSGSQVWFEPESKVLTLPNLSSKYAWTVMDLASDFSEFGTAYALVRGNLLTAESSKLSKSKKSKAVDPSPATIDLASEVFAIVKLDADRDEILYARQLNCGADIPTYLRLSGGFIWVLYHSGLVSVWGKRYGVPVTRSSPSGIPELLTLRLGGPTSLGGEVSHQPKKSKSSGSSTLLLGFLVAVTPEDSSTFYVYSAISNASNISISKEIISVFDDGVETSHSTAKVGSLANAIGSLAAAGASIFAAPAPLPGVASTEDAEDSNEGGPSSVLAGLPRRHKRKLAAAQAKYDAMMAQRSKVSSSAEEDKLNEGTVSNNATNDASLFGRRPVINFKSDAVQDFLRRLQNNLVDDSPLMRSDWALVKLLTSTGSLSMTTYHGLIKSAMKGQRLDVLCDLAQHCPDLTEMQAVSIILYALSCSDAVIGTNKLIGGHLAYGQHEHFTTSECAAPEASSTSKSKKSKKGTSDSANSAVENAQSKSEAVDATDDRRLCVHAVMEALIHRKCAFTSATLVEAIRRGLSADVCMVLISVLWSMLRGFCSTVDVSIHLRGLGDRQVSLAINWMEALLDSHFLDYAVTLSSTPKKSKREADSSSRLVSSVVRMISKSMAGLDAAQLELEQVYGLWTHIHRCCAAGMGDAHTGLGGSQSPSNSIYQVETLVL